MKISPFAIEDSDLEIAEAMNIQKTAVIALGGNAITRPDLEDTIANQFANTRRSLDGIVELAREGYGLVVTHGNGPQVGNSLLRTELSRSKTPILPLGVLVADTEGGMGYMIEQSLQNRLKAEGIDRPVTTIITQVVVDQKDPAILNPTKYIGQFYSSEEAKKYQETRGWIMKKDSDRGWRRVVPSPMPIKTVPGEIIRQLVQQGTIVIAAGGGGIPVYIDDDGNYDGIDAVIDKDRASAVLAREVDADILSILTSVKCASLNFGKTNQRDLGQVTLSEMEKYIKEGHFPPGSMGPKVEAAMQFMRNGGKMVTISSLKDAQKAVHGQIGTRIIPD
ncbi:MAG: carbamate kinase [candidate division Zixibacteria bacterium]|nr:carbamate kinase [candidate division Zixibacteria bacterium]